jgi:hypothetical protein
MKKDYAKQRLQELEAEKEKLTAILQGPDEPKHAMGIIKTYEDACTVLKLNPVTQLPISNPKTSEDKAINAVKKLFIVAKALNEGWVPDWDNSNERKWWPWFCMDSAGSGFRFDVAYFECTYTYTIVGSRLCFKNKELAQYAGTQFIEIYKEFMVL